MKRFIGSVHGVALWGLTTYLCLFAQIGAAAPYAAVVMDARSGKVVHARNADTRLHPASLTKMMTLYIAFEAIERGEISLDTQVRISARAAAEPPSKLGLRKGQRIKLRYLIRAAAVKSANDAATAIGEAISGSEAAFARRMNRTARALGMTRTTFKNANGLTEAGHLSTARDMTILGRHVLYDYPEYYNLFSRRSADVGGRKVPNTNRRLLANYRGADGIKTGYTRAAGFNLVASAERGSERVIATVFGGRSSASRNARVAQLLDMGFKRSPSRVALRKPGRPVYSAPTKSNKALSKVGKTIRVVTALKVSPRPVARPQAAPEPAPLLLALQDTINKTVAEVQSTEQDAPEVQVAEGVETVDTPVKEVRLVSAATEQRPQKRPPQLAPVQSQVITRASTSGGRYWGVNIGTYPSRYKAERVMLKVALQEMSTLDGSLRKIVKRSRGYDANFMGLSKQTAALACRRLQARAVDCETIGPS